MVVQNVVELLDDLFQRAAAADEPEELNFVHKHARSMQAKVRMFIGVSVLAVSV